MPIPAPLYNVALSKEVQVSNTHKYLPLQFTYKQSYKSVDIAGRCDSASHEEVINAEQVRVQNLLKDCYDPSDKTKLVFFEGIQNTDVLKLNDPNYTAVLFRSLVVAKRNC
jgi:hypothetical protein